MDILSELCYYIFYKKTLERMIFMASAQATKTTEPALSCTFCMKCVSTNHSKNIIYIE